MTTQHPHPTERLSGILYSKLFPNPAEPGRGIFVAEQLEITRDAVDWRVIAPVPWVPQLLASPRRPYVRGNDDYAGVPVAHPRYLVAPRKIAYTTVGGAMASSARASFEQALSARAQFVHAHTLYPAGAAALRNAAGRIPVIVTVHGSDLRTNIVRDEWRAELQRVVGEAAAVVCVSRSLATELAEHLHVDSEKVLVIPNSFDDATFRYVARPAAARTVKGFAPVRLVSVGNLVRVKGVDILLEALAKTVAAGANATLTVVGAGDERATLEARASQPDLAGRVTFAGRVDKEQLVEQLHSADLFVLPSRQEGFGVALVEALATGLPAVVTASGGPEEILGGSFVPGLGSGLVVRPGDAADLARVLQKAVASLPDFDREAIAADVHTRFSRAAVSERLVSLYRRIVDGASPSISTPAEGDA